MKGVRLGLRLQILLLLGALLLAAFLPLFFAVSTYARFTLHEVRETSARALGRAIAGQVSEARARRPDEDLTPLLAAHVGVTGVEMIALLDRSGRVQDRVGDPAGLAVLGAVNTTREAVRHVVTSHGPALAFVVPDPRGAVVAILRTDEESTRVEPLVRLSGLYMGLVALSLLVLSYFALTRSIVAPLLELSRAAQRVAGGARRLDVPRGGARELVELGESLRAMTDRLISEEQALRGKVEEVERTTQSLREAQDRLVRSEQLASVGRLAAGIAHEIGNPIAAIMGMQDLLLDGGLEPAQERDFLRRMRNETDRINNIVRDLLDFARPAAKNLSSSSEPTNVEAAIHDTVALVTPQKSFRDVQLDVDVSPALPPVRLAREHLVQVLLNLLLNAADACGPGGHVKVLAGPAGDGVAIAVEDDGPGVAADVRSRLFEPFATTKDVGKGTGLGLAVCRGLVEASGGTIDLDAAHAPGARFVVVLRAALAPRPNTDADAERSQNDGTP
ncbi:MAG TPA: HAMP domain-containing sensor histidine kinase [Polyangiaceae bacterium]|nr:HAMP domain-containing sensor histidine kinase [Polyangiaceae bacterium]